jgi:hypothetical protein
VILKGIGEKHVLSFKARHQHFIIIDDVSIVLPPTGEYKEYIRNVFKLFKQAEENIHGIKMSILKWSEHYDVMHQY